MTTPDDRKMLELAALAAGTAGIEVEQANHGRWRVHNGKIFVTWDPLNSNYDAFALMVKLKLRMDYVGDQPCIDGILASGMTAEESSRKAIVRAAAMIGQRMKEQG